MKKEITRKDRRIGVIVNYICLMLLIAIFFTGEHYGWSIPLIGGIIVAFLVVIISFNRVQIKTGLWNLAHTKTKGLDEREMQVTHEALRASYSIFSIVCLVIIYVNSIAEKGNIHILIFAAVLYLAHTLPSSVIAWTEKEVLKSE